MLPMAANSCSADGTGFAGTRGWGGVAKAPTADGEMTDPYTGEHIVFEQAADKSGYLIELDHGVSLADAFVSGG